MNPTRAPAPGVSAPAPTGAAAQPPGAASVATSSAAPGSPSTSAPASPPPGAAPRSASPQVSTQPPPGAAPRSELTQAPTQDPASTSASAPAVAAPASPASPSVGPAPAPATPDVQASPPAPAVGAPEPVRRRVPVWPEPGARGGAAADAAARTDAPAGRADAAPGRATAEPDPHSGRPTAPSTPRATAPSATRPTTGATPAPGARGPADSTAGAAPVITRVQPVPPAYPGTAASAAGGTARPAADSPLKATISVRAGGAAPVPATPATSATPAPATATTAPAPAPAAAPSAPAPADRPATPDFGRIAGVGVRAVAVPTAAVVRVARRRNVIGAETTGSIPVHLLFRDEPGRAAPFGAGADDGGPDTVAMAPPTLPSTGRNPAIPGPSKTQAPEHPRTGAGAGPASRNASGTTSGSPADDASRAHLKTPDARPKDRSAPWAKARRKAKATGAPAPVTAPSASSATRPVPTADPALVERPGPALPGWVGVAGGALALAGCAAVVWWAGAVPGEAARMLRLPERPYHGIHLGQWALLALGVVLALFALGGLGRGRVGYAWVLTLFGDYRGTVRRTGLVWVSPLLLRRRVDVRLRHWRSEPLSAVDAKGTALDVTVLVVWRVRDTVRAALGVDGHEDYLREQVEAAMARVLSQLPADAFHEDAPTLRDAEAVGEALTRMLSAECAPVGVDVFSAQPTRIEYAPDVAAAMRRRRIAAIDAKHRDSVLTSVVDAVDDVVHRLTSRGLVELDDYERKALVKDLTVAFYTGRTGPVEGA
ncbi:SPFH domain-containing protein [Streptomyces sp. NPDC014891]|uniref:SPFH domain-containing protein n=1 Tax=Streptomyces sp. NPDC014891 TaxID=3364929 RepID=UPI003702F3CF